MSTTLWLLVTLYLARGVDGFAAPLNARSSTRVTGGADPLPAAVGGVSLDDDETAELKRLLQSPSFRSRATERELQLFEKEYERRTGDTLEVDSPLEFNRKHPLLAKLASSEEEEEDNAVDFKEDPLKPTRVLVRDPEETMVKIEKHAHKSESFAEYIAKPSASSGMEQAPPAKEEVEEKERIAISWRDQPPRDASLASMALLGVFIRQEDDVNGHPCYANEAQPNSMLWFSPNHFWSIGKREHLGTAVCNLHSLQADVAQLKDVTGAWQITDRFNKAWLNTANSIAVSATASSSSSSASASGSASTSLEGGIAATAAERIAISWGSEPPPDASTSAAALLGVFVKQPELVNGHPCYANEMWADTMLWLSPNHYWSIGSREHLGTDTSCVYSTQAAMPLPNEITGYWRISNRQNAEWLNADSIRVNVITPAPPAAAEAVAAASYFSTSPQQQEAREYYDEGMPPRAGEAQVEAESATENGRVEARQALEKRVGDVVRRVLLTLSAEVTPCGGDEQQQQQQEAKYRELISPAFDAWAADQIDDEELRRRKRAARQQVNAEHDDRLTLLDTAYGAYVAATAASADAEHALEAALAAEDEALKGVDAALTTVEAEERTRGATTGRSNVVV